MKSGIRKKESWAIRWWRHHDASFWHNTGAWRTDGRTDMLLLQRPALA